MGIQKYFLNQLFDQPHQLAAPFSNKTASFYSLLKIAVSLKPEDAVTHVMAKRKKSYFFCFRLWEESCCAVPAPAGLMLAPAWASRSHRQPSGSGIPSFAAAARQLFEMQVPCSSACSLLALEGRCAATATTKNKPVGWQVAAFGSGGFGQSLPKDEGVSCKLQTCKWEMVPLCHR